MIVAIDGPSGAGKSTLAKRVAKDLGFTYLDTGALYRALALKVLRQGLEVEDEGNLAALVRTTEVDLVDSDGRLEVLLDGVDVSDLIRTPEVSQTASRISELALVRQKMLEVQRALGARGNVVAEGRDIGTVVFPEAEIKIYLDANLQERARRRCEELRKAGRHPTLEETQREIAERDRRDSARALAPLRRAEDAFAIDSSALDADTVAERVKKMIRSRSLEN